MHNYMSQLIHSGKGPGVTWIAKSLSMLTEIKKFGNSIYLSYNFQIYWLISLKVLWQSMVALRVSPKAAPEGRAGNLQLKCLSPSGAAGREPDMTRDPANMADSLQGQLSQLQTPAYYWAYDIKSLMKLRFNR